MTQSVVTFITGAVPTGPTSPPLQTENRVFDFEITSTAQSLYDSEMQALLNDFNSLSGQVRDFNTVSPITANDFANHLNNLLGWSKAKYVDANGNQLERLTRFVNSLTNTDSAQTVIGYIYNL